MRARIVAALVVPIVTALVIGAVENAQAEMFFGIDRMSDLFWWLR